MQSYSSFSIWSIPFEIWWYSSFESFNPKDAKSYVYLAKIYNLESNEKEEEKNINTALLLEPTNEEATYMLMEIKLKKSNYSKVKELSNKFEKICIP